MEELMSMSDADVRAALAQAGTEVDQMEEAGIPDQDAYRAACHREERLLRESGRRRAQRRAHRGDPLTVAQEAHEEIGPDLNALADMGTLELLRHLETLGRDDLRTVVERATALTGAAITVYGQRFGEENPSV